MKEAEANKEADEKRKEEADIRNDADALVFQTEQAIKDLGDKADESDKKEAEEKVEALKEALKGDNTDDIKTKTEELKEVAMKLAQKVYENAAKENNATENNDTTETKEDNVEEASYEEK